MSDDDNKVGYKRPPKHTQFQPGESGNPAGRTKGSKKFKTILNEQMNKEIRIDVGGKTVRCSQKEALLMRVINDAMKGNHKAMAIAFKLMPDAEDAYDELCREQKSEAVAIARAIMEKHALRRSEKPELPVAGSAEADAFQDDDEI